MRNTLEEEVDVSGLFGPAAVGAVAVRNRFAMAPLSRYAARSGVPAPELGEFYRRRAAGGVGLIISEGIAVGEGGGADGSGVAGIQEGRAEAGWREIVAAVHTEGVPIFAQLMHGGAGVVESERTVADYVAAAGQARRAGFDGIEIHGAHGMLPARAGFVAELVGAVAEAVGPAVPIGYRFSQWEVGRYDERMARTPAALEAVLRPLVEAGVAVFHPSTRRFDEPEFPELGGAGGELGLAGWTKVLTGRPVITVGSIGLSKVGEAAMSLRPLVRRFERGEFDIAAVGRAVLANPDFVELVRDGRTGELVPYDEDKHKSTLE
ncbi:12-oxophytodienoate reductase [Nocardia sp. ET3-3]|uniref:12-oxophytodienoate reductase n=1 Tax=Nocardia terrae TaxID=2675851 RepID=A0A7K1URM6_9NOCA|nr:12-oxophytodienoate reductase [Nocardia terrae]MVU76957.1 12-oxophytodienoate reductase [Nocardia terrae]